MKRTTYVAIVAILLICVIAIILSFRHTKSKELNLLAWVGYDEQDMLEPFEKKYNVKVNVKTYIGGDSMFALFTQSQRTYDVVVIDPEFIQKLHGAGRLAPLNPDDYNFTDYFEPLKKFPLAWIDDKLYAVLIRWGANALVYNTNHLTQEDVKSYNILWQPKVKGKIGIWDWYLPSMGVLSRGTGNRDPYTISNDQFSTLKRHLMELRPQVAAIHPTPPELFAALASEQTWIVPAGGESFAAVLTQQGKPIDWTIPDEGGVMWVETLGIANDAPHPDVAKLYIQWMQTPEAQALLTHRAAYSSQVPNSKAYALLSPQQRDLLKIHNEADANAIISKLAVRRLPVNQSEGAWQDAWQDFKSR
jgi:spermidine/putrescine transport system substrate-binding protein